MCILFLQTAVICIMLPALAKSPWAQWAGACSDTVSLSENAVKFWIFGSPTGEQWYLLFSFHAKERFAFYVFIRALALFSNLIVEVLYILRSLTLCLGIHCKFSKNLAICIFYCVLVGFLLCIFYYKWLSFHLQNLIVSQVAVEKWNGKLLNSESSLMTRSLVPLLPVL